MKKIACGIVVLAAVLTLAAFATRVQQGHTDPPDLPLEHAQAAVEWLAAFATR